MRADRSGGKARGQCRHYPRSPKQIAVRLQGVMQYGTELLLPLSIQMDQKITTDDQIDAYKGRVLKRVMRCKQDAVAHLFAYAIILAVFDEETAQLLFRDVRRDSFRIATFAGYGESFFV